MPDGGSRMSRRRPRPGRVPSDICHLTSDLCTRAFLGLPPFGLLEPDARAWGWARAQHEKGIWWMPWYREAMKDVARCEKPRGGASARRSSDLRMGQPTRQRVSSAESIG